MSVIDLITFNDKNKLIFHKNNLLELINNIPNEQKIRNSFHSWTI